MLLLETGGYSRGWREECSQAGRNLVIDVMGQEDRKWMNRWGKGGGETGPWRGKMKGGVVMGFGKCERAEKTETLKIQE